MAFQMVYNYTWKFLLISRLDFEGRYREWVSVLMPVGEVQECMDPVEYFNGNLLQYLQYILNKIEKVDWLLRQLPTTLAWRDIKKISC